MKASNKYKYWAMLSDYDIETAKVLMDAQRWVYVSYMCQQALERQLKGMYVYYMDCEAPKSHNLPFLFEKIKSSPNFPEIGPLSQEDIDCFEDFFSEVMFYYMSDYPFSYKNIKSRFIDLEIANKLYESTLRCLNHLRTMQQVPEQIDIELLGK